MNGDPQDRYVITLVATGTDPRPAIIRLRQLLKIALRGFKLRCVACSPSVEKGRE